MHHHHNRVWRHRGGRDGCESVEQFLGFLNPSHRQTEEPNTRRGWKGNYAGVVAFRSPISIKNEPISRTKLIELVTEQAALLSSSH
ncbi:hypothetical protein BC937DRAFT_89493 [Endogone sp. FLAS-F59071]|nr:hypothetical protein BC937DRAFT_89493 [Endogone sp. FLAS-F59071]|eukprot:RUS22373.1 hypothetical protein BC937DRAFT_89493 [Endogone sp. FLAS-F59071]